MAAAGGARPRDLAAHCDPDAAAPAAAHAAGLAKAHGFGDGNRRIAWIAARLFLAGNGLRPVFDRAEAVRMMEGAAAGTVGEEDLAAWFRARLETPGAE